MEDNFKNIKEKALNVIENHREDQFISEPEDVKTLLKFFKYHPEFHNKFKSGFKFFIKRKNKDWGNMCIYIINNQDEEIPISKNFRPNYTETKKDRCLKALRESVQPIINKKRISFSKGQICEISGVKINSKKDLHIDHHNLDFIDIVIDWMDKYDISYTNLFDYVEKIGTKHHITDEKIKNNFIKFHNSNTTLRYVTKDANLKKKKSRKKQTN